MEPGDSYYPRQRSFQEQLAVSAQEALNASAPHAACRQVLELFSDVDSPPTQHTLSMLGPQGQHWLARDINHLSQQRIVDAGKIDSVQTLAPYDSYMGPNSLAVSTTVVRIPMAGPNEGSSEESLLVIAQTHRLPGVEQEPWTTAELARAVPVFAIKATVNEGTPPVFTSYAFQDQGGSWSLTLLKPEVADTIVRGEFIERLLV